MSSPYTVPSVSRHPVRIWVCKAGDAVLCAFTTEQAAYDWCDEANRNGTYRQQGMCFAVEVWLNS